MPEKSIRDILYQLRYGGESIDTALSEIKEILKGQITEILYIAILDEVMTQEYGMFRVVDKIIEGIK